MEAIVIFLSILEGKGEISFCFLSKNFKSNGCQTLIDFKIVIEKKNKVKKNEFIPPYLNS